MQLKCTAIEYIIVQIIDEDHACTTYLARKKRPKQNGSVVMMTRTTITGINFDLIKLAAGTYIVNTRINVISFVRGN